MRWNLLILTSCPSSKPTTATATATATPDKEKWDEAEEEEEDDDEDDDENEDEDDDDDEVVCWSNGWLLVCLSYKWAKQMGPSLSHFPFPFPYCHVPASSGESFEGCCSLEL